MVTVQLWPWVVSYSVTKPSFSLSSIVDLFSWTYFFSLIDSANSGEKGKERATRWFLRWLTGRERDGKSCCRQKSEDKLPYKTFSAFMPPVFFPWGWAKKNGFFSSQVVSSLVDSVHSCRYSANLVSRALFTVVQWKGSGCHNRSKIFDISWSPLTPNCFTLTSVCIFSILFFTHFLRCWQGEFV